MLFTRCWLGRTKIQQGTVFREELNLCSIKLPNSAAALERSEISTLSSRKPSLCNIQVGHWQDMQSGLGGGNVDKELLDFEAGLEQEAGARFDEAVLLTSLFVWYNYTRRLGDLKFMSRMRSAVEWSKQMDLDEEKAGGGGGGGGERQRGTCEEVELF